MAELDRYWKRGVALVAGVLIPALPAYAKAPADPGGLHREGVRLLQEDRPGEALRLFEGHEDQRAHPGVVTTWLAAALGADALEDVPEVLTEALSKQDRIPAPGAFQHLALEAGTRFLEREDFDNAIVCLRRLIPRQQLIEQQEGKLERALRASAAADARGTKDETLEREIVMIRRDLAAMKATPSPDLGVQWRLAAAFLESGRAREAALLLKPLSEEPPDESVRIARARLVEALAALGDAEGALAAAEAAREAPGSSELLLTAARALLEKGRFVEAAAAFRRSADQFPDTAARAKLGQAHARLAAGDAEAALRAFAELQESAEGGREAAFGMAHSWLVLRDYKKARAAFEFCLNRAGRDAADRADIRFLKSYAAFAAGDLHTAVRELRKALRDGIGDQEGLARLTLGSALAASGDPDQALAALDKISPETGAAYDEGQMLKAQIHRENGEIDAMEKILESFIEANRESSRIAEAWYWLGWSKAQGGRPDEAVQLYLEKARAFGSDPGAEGVEWMLADLERLLPKGEERETTRRRFSQELSSIVEEADEDGDSTLALRALWANGRLLEESDITRSSFYLSAAAARVAPGETSPRILADVADALRSLGRIEEAERLYRTILETRPPRRTTARAHAGLGLIRYAQGAHAAALEHFEAFLKEAEDRRPLDQILLIRAGALANRGRLEEAKADLRTLLQLESAGPDERQRAALEMGELLLREQDEVGALKAFGPAYRSEFGKPDVAFQAGLRMGEVFQSINKKDEALQHYRAMMARESFQELDFAELHARVKSLEEAEP